MADFLEGKNPVTVAMVAVIIVVAVIAVFAGNLTGYATSSTEVSLLGPNGEYIYGPLYVGPWSHEGWGDCTGLVPWETVNKICKDKYGYSGALPEDGTQKPCLHTQTGTAYMLNLETMQRESYDTQDGYGLTAIKCI